MLKIFILAGGLGTRLSGIISDVPKPMAPVENLPFLEYQIKLIEKSISDYQLILLTQYKSEIIEQYFKNKDKIETIKEDYPLGTGGSIKNAMKILNHEIDEPALILNGDSYIDVDYLSFTKECNNDINILCTYQENCKRSSTLEIENNIINKFNKQGFKEKNSYISTGCYYLKNTELIQNYPEDHFMIENVFEDVCKSNKLHAYMYDGMFIDIGIPEDYFKFCEYIKNEY